MIRNSDSAYAPLINPWGDERKHRESHRTNSSSGSLFVLPVVALAVAMGLCCYFLGQSSTYSISDIYLGPHHVTSLKRHDEHTVPTPLSVVDPETDRYLYALNVPLYDKFRKTLMNASIRELRGRPTQNLLKNPPRLTLDRTVTTIHAPLTLSWTGGLPKGDDILALYCPHDHPHHLFQDVATLSQARATSAKHGGSNKDSWYFPSFPIVRQNTCQFRLYQQSTGIPLAESPILHIRDSTKTPTGVHLAFTNDTTKMVVQFTSGEKGTPVAMYGINETTTKVEGTSHTYTATEMCQAPANLTETGKFQDPGMLHVVTLGNLEPDTDYVYKVGLAGPQGIVWSDIFQFHSAPLVGDKNEFSYVVYGDQGCPSVGWGQGGLWTSAMAARESAIRAVHHFGDLSYARGAAHIWDEWFHMIQSFSAHVPLLVGVGNHEYDYTVGGGNGKDPSGLNASHSFSPAWGNYGNDSGGECGVPTSQRFTMPSSDGSNGVFWYSHEYATVHSTFISSEHNLTKGSPQYEWLEKDLKAVNRSKTPWLVVESHRPMYESEAFFDQAAVCAGMRYQIEDLLREYNVDVFLAGHYHMYQRTCDGLYRSKCNNGGPLHITVGSAGASLDYGTSTYPQKWTAQSIYGEYGYGRITVANASTLHWEFVKAGSENDTTAGEIHDDVWIIRRR
jgi:hypothetical protein